MVDLRIRGGTVVTQDGEWAADVLVDQGRIAGLVAPETACEAAESVDATGLHVLPGVIDPHTHLPNRGRTFAESCEVFSRTQVSGGTTSSLSFIFADGSYLPVLDELAVAVAERSLVDMGGIPILMTKQHVAEIPELTLKRGVTSYKVFMAARGQQLYPKTMSVDDGLIWLALRETARLRPQPFIQVHAENWEIAWALSEELQAAGRNDAAAWTEARPSLCEEDSLRQFAFLVGKAGATGYGVHLTTREAPGIVADCWARGVRLYGETCPHYLTCYDTHPRAAFGKFQPSVKSREDTEALWAAIRAGWIHCMGSDHIPITLQEKNPEADIWQVQAGVPGSGTILPMMLHYGVHQGRVSLSDVVRVCSYNTARIFGLYPQKGCLLPGADADLVLVDLKREVVVTPELLNVDFSLYDGERFVGWPRMTFVRGRLVCADGRIAEPVGGGRELRRRLAPSLDPRGMGVANP